MRLLPLACLSLSLVAAPASAQDFLGRIAQNAAQNAAQGVAQRAAAGVVNRITQPRPATPAPAPAQAPARTQAPAPASAQAAAPAPAQSGGVLVRNGMPVVSSDGVVVGDVMHVPGEQKVFGDDETFFTADNTYRLRRIYGREVTVSGGTVRLKMTAAQYRARGQNPDQ